MVGRLELVSGGGRGGGGYGGWKLFEQHISALHKNDIELFYIGFYQLIIFSYSDNKVAGFLVSYIRK